MGDRAGEEVCMLAVWLLACLAWCGSMLPGMGYWCWGTDSLLDSEPIVMLCEVEVVAVVGR